MARLYTGDELISVVRMRGGLNDTDSQGSSDTDILNVLNEEALTTLYEVVQRCREEFYLARERIPFTSATRYRIPARAMHNRVRDVLWVESDGTRHNLYPIPLEDQPCYSATGDNIPFGYTFEGNLIQILPLEGSFSGNLEVVYFLRPNELVMSTACRQVETVSLTTGAITLDSDMPTSWTTSLTYDFHSQYSGAELKAWGLTPSVAALDDMTFAAADINGTTVGRMPVEVGDYVCIAETCALPGLPRELHPVLAQAAMCRILESTDPERFQVSNTELQAMLQRQYTLFSKRDESENLTANVWNSPHVMAGVRRTVYGKGTGF
jgi:hypothetical protein